VQIYLFSINILIINEYKNFLARI